MRQALAPYLSCKICVFAVHFFSLFPVLRGGVNHPFLDP